jgi:hypothetical protein
MVAIQWILHEERELWPKEPKPHKAREKVRSGNRINPTKIHTI